MENRCFLSFRYSSFLLTVTSTINEAAEYNIFIQKVAANTAKNLELMISRFKLHDFHSLIAKGLAQSLWIRILRMVSETPIPSYLYSIFTAVKSCRRILVLTGSISKPCIKMLVV